MTLKTTLYLLIFSLFVTSCLQSVETPTLPVETVNETTTVSHTPTLSKPSATAIPETGTPDTSLEFEIVSAEIVPEKDSRYKDLIRPGVNVKVVLSNLDTGWLPEDQMVPKNFCGVCVGWDNAGLENDVQVVVLHFYSFDLNVGENTITISAHGFKKQTTFFWEPSDHPTPSTNAVNPFGEYEIIDAAIVTRSDTAYNDYLRPGVNVRIVISKLDTGLLPEDQLRPNYFCSPCVGWDNAGIKGGNQIVVLHYYSSSLAAGENTLNIQAYGVVKEFVIDFDASSHLVK